ncbi:MAG: flagellar export protein FliJ [Pseudomonadota bacterium]
MKSRESLLRLKRFQVDEKRRQVAQIEAMIADFQRMADELDHQISSEQERVGITDVTHFAYPTFAKAAIQRRDNLQASANDLDSQLENAREALAEAVEELKKFEQLEERDNAREQAEAEAAEQDDMDEIAARRHAVGR